MKLRFKLDESLSPDLAQILDAAGHDVTTVRGQGMKGKPDQEVAAVCQREERCLLTLDTDFGQILAYPPDQYAGIVVLRHPRPTLGAFRTLVEQVAVAVERESPVRKLWIVEPGRIRIHDKTESEQR